MVGLTDRRKASAGVCPVAVAFLNNDNYCLQPLAQGSQLCSVVRVYRPGLAGIYAESRSWRAYICLSRDAVNGAEVVVQGPRWGRPGPYKDGCEDRGFRCASIRCCKSRKSVNYE